MTDVRQTCDGNFEPATGGTLAELWANKRAILKKARTCGQFAQMLADKAENRNKVLGNE